MSPTPTISRATVVNLTIVVEAILLLVATGWSWLTDTRLLPVLNMDYKPMLLGIVAGAGTALSAYILLLISRKTSWLAQLREMTDTLLLPLVTHLTPADIFLIAALSGFCEEIFFRGVAQPKFGLILTSIAFGLFHDPSFRNLSYSFLAFLYGLALGALYLYTGNLWTPIFAHATHNLITLFVLKYKTPPAATAPQG